MGGCGQIGHYRFIAGGVNVADPRIFGDVGGPIVGIGKLVLTEGAVADLKNVGITRGEHLSGGGGSGDGTPLIRQFSGFSLTAGANLCFHPLNFRAGNFTVDVDLRGVAQVS